MEKSKTKQFMHNRHFCKMFECDLHVTKWKKVNQTFNKNFVKCLFYVQIMFGQLHMYIHLFIYLELCVSELCSL